MERTAPEHRDFWFGRKLSQNPCQVIMAVIVLCLLISSSIIITGTFRLWENSRRAYYVEDDIRTERYDALVLAREELGKQGNTLVPLQSQIQDDFTITMYFELKRGILLTPDNIRHMYDAEQKIAGRTEFESLCYIAPSDSTCSTDAYLSLTSLFNITEDLTQAEIDDTLALNATQKAIELYMDSNFDGTASSSRYARSIFQFGLPLARASLPNGQYLNDQDDADAQEDVYRSFVEQFALEIAEESNTGSLRVYAFGNILFNILFQLVANRDLLFAVGSIAFVFCYMSFHMRSIFLAAMGCLELALAFPVSYAIYRLVFQIEYFDTIHLLTIFVILGIAADDFFVFVDAWQQAHVQAPELLHDEDLHVCWTYRRAAKAMWSTSFTTIGAFVATGFSPLVPIGSFGFFAATLVLVNFLLAISLFPAAVVIADEHFWPYSYRQLAHRAYTCIMCCKAPAPAASSSSIEMESPSHEIGDTTVTVQDIQESDKEDYRIVERYFFFTHAPVIHKLRYVVLVCLIAWGATAAYFALQIAPISEREDFYPSDHFLSRAVDVSTDNTFAKTESDNLPTIEFVYGIRGVDRAGSSRWNPEEYGRPVFDATFDLTPAAAQQHLSDACDAIRLESLIQRDEDNEPLVNCFIQEFASWVTDETAFDFPTPPASFNSLLRQWTEETEEGKQAAAEQRVAFDDDDTVALAVLDGILAVNFREPERVLRPLYDAWVAFVKEQNNAAPPTVNKMYQTTGDLWVFMITESAFVSSAVQGIIIASCIAFITLLLSTMNIIVTCLATISIAGILASVMSIVVFIGWDLGTAESIASVILIGFSVDYVVHLGNSYMEFSHLDTRYEKMANALRDLGISVVAGAITTLGCGMFLFGAELTFFLKFAVFLTLTVVFSLAWSLLFFTAAMFTVGPEGKQGSVRALIAYLRNKQTT